MIRLVILIAVGLLTCCRNYSQELENNIVLLEQQAEFMADESGTDNEDDAYLLQLDNFRKHPLNLNKADAADLIELLLLNDLQIQSLINYRRLLGNLLDIYELQAVPGWNIAIINKLLPFITVEQNANLLVNLNDRLRNGSHSFLLRSSRVLEKAAGYRKSDSTNRFQGNANRVMMRFRYNYRNLLQWGLLGDKDAGESFFKEKQKAGFDFYSFHLFISRLGLVKSLALGDFAVNMGQGLVQWQSLAFKKSAAVTSVKRQSSVLRPYTSAGEFNFHRGAGITLQKNKWEATLFISSRKLSGNLIKDPLTNEGHISSILSSGYYRTANELADKNNLRQFVAGGALRYTTAKGHIAVNGILYGLSLPYQKQEQPYNLFAPSGKKFANESIDYSYTYKNFHFFGELAADRKINKAFLQGVLASLSPAVDLSLVYRSIAKDYHSFNANAFTESTTPINEKGFFAGLSIRPFETIQVNAFADHYHFPWLKYRVDAPSSGSEYFAQVTYKPGKQAEIYTYYSREIKQQNTSNSIATTSTLQNINRQNWRIHNSISLSREISLRNRVETIFYNKKQADKEEGFLLFTDVLYKSSKKHWSGNIRLLYFETTGYNSRLYAFENDIQYNFSVPVIFDKGYRYYLNLQADISKWTQHLLSAKITGQCWLKASQTIYTSKQGIGTGPDAINGNRKSEIKFQVIFNY